MNGLLAMTDEEPPRLYSKESRLPRDIVAPQHAAIHIELDGFGRWNRERYKQGTCNSIEKRFFKGGRDATPASTAPVGVNPLYSQIDRVVRMMLYEVPRHGETIKLYYVGRLREDRPRRPGDQKRATSPTGLIYIPCRPEVICRLMTVRPADFPTWMGHCRSMVINLLRRQGSTQHVVGN